MGKKKVGEVYFAVEKTQVFTADDGEEDRYSIYADLALLISANRKDMMTLYQLLREALDIRKE